MPRWPLRLLFKAVGDHGVVGDHEVAVDDLEVTEVGPEAGSSTQEAFDIEVW